MNERLKTRYPEDVYEGEGAMDEEAYFGRLNELAEERDAELDGYKKSDEELRNIMERDPRSAQFISDMANGRHPLALMIETVGIDRVKELLEDPVKMEEFIEEHKNYLERVAREKSLGEEYKKNLAESMSLSVKMQAERGLDDAAMKAAMGLVTDIADDAIVGKFSEATLDMALKALNHDSDVANAREEGQITGRNEKIRAELRKPTQGDVPMLNGGGKELKPQAPKKKSIFDDLPKRKF